MVIESVDQYYDESIYQQLLDDYNSDDARDTLNDKIRKYGFNCQCQWRIEYLLLLVAVV